MVLGLYTDYFRLMSRLCVCVLVRVVYFSKELTLRPTVVFHLSFLLGEEEDKKWLLRLARQSCNKIYKNGGGSKLENDLETSSRWTKKICEPNEVERFESWKRVTLSFVGLWSSTATPSSHRLQRSHRRERMPITKAYGLSGWGFYFSSTGIRESRTIPVPSTGKGHHIKCGWFDMFHQVWTRCCIQGPRWSILFLQEAQSI